MLTRGHSHSKVLGGILNRKFVRNLNSHYTLLNISSTFVLRRQECALRDAACRISESDPEDFSDETNAENLYGASPPSTPRQMKRM